MTDIAGRLEACVERIGSILSCSLCGRVLDEPYRVVTCNHSFCKDCAKGELNGNCRCPMCKLPAYPRDLTLNKQLRNLVVGYTRLKEEALHFIRSGGAILDSPSEKNADVVPEAGENRPVSSKRKKERWRQESLLRFSQESTGDTTAHRASRQPSPTKRKKKKWRQGGLTLSEDGSLHSERSERSAQQPGKSRRRSGGEQSALTENGSCAASTPAKAASPRPPLQRREDTVFKENEHVPAAQLGAEDEAGTQSPLADRWPSSQRRALQPLSASSLEQCQNGAAPTEARSTEISVDVGVLPDASQGDEHGLRRRPRTRRLLPNESASGDSTPPPRDIQDDQEDDSGHLSVSDFPTLSQALDRLPTDGGGSPPHGRAPSPFLETPLALMSPQTGGVEGGRPPEEEDRTIASERDSKEDECSVLWQPVEAREVLLLPPPPVPPTGAASETHTHLPGTEGSESSSEEHGGVRLAFTNVRGLSAKAVLLQLAHDLGGEVVDDARDMRGISHLVTRVDRRGSVIHRSIKFMLALASRRWIVREDWLHESARAGRWLPEAPFQPLGIDMVASRARPPPFANLVVGFLGTFPSPEAPQSHLELLISAAGGRLAAADPTAAAAATRELPSPSSSDDTLSPPTSPPDSPHQIVVMDEISYRSRDRKPQELGLFFRGEDVLNCILEDRSLC